MIQELKAYPEYKPTRVDWLDALPRHWTELSLKRIAVLDNSGSYGDDPDGGGLVLPVATTAQIDRDGNFNVSKMPRRGFSEREVSRFACKPGIFSLLSRAGMPPMLFLARWDSCGPRHHDLFSATFSCGLSHVGPTFSQSFYFTC